MFKVRIKIVYQDRITYRYEYFSCWEQLVAYISKIKYIDVLDYLLIEKD